MAQPLPKHRAREYETIFILHPDTVAETISQITERLKDVVKKLNGKMLRGENWGKRRLAYQVKKQHKGIYIYFRYLGYSDMVEEIERILRMTEPVLKHLTVKVEEDVNPEARPVREEDISFIMPVVEEREVREHKSDTGSAFESHNDEPIMDDHPDDAHFEHMDDVEAESESKVMKSDNQEKIPSDNVEIDEEN